MATYAAFKHVELYNVGKAKKRVLRPPGGGSTDIFSGDMPSTPRNTKNRMASNIFSVEKDSVKNNGETPRRAQKTVDSHNRLFGGPDRAFTPAKNHMKSSIPIGGEANGHANGNGKASNGHYSSNGGSKNGSENGLSLSSSNSSIASSNDNFKQNGVSKTVFRKMSNGNPVTGEGYKGGEINTAIPSLNGANQVINKNRIPPGGFSSGLW